MKKKKTQSESWEKEFDKRFNFLGTYNQDELDKLTVNAMKYLELKDFIRQEKARSYTMGYVTGIEVLLKEMEAERKLVKK